VIYIIGALFIGLFIFLFTRESEKAKLERFKREYQISKGDMQNIDFFDVVSERLAYSLDNALQTFDTAQLNLEFRIQYPRLSQKQVNEYWRELKRYFILVAIFKKVEMFHSKVDELWHLMLKDEKNYERFCQEYIGSKIQHISHSQPTFKPTERTFLDFCYVQLFTVDKVSLRIWGKFFKEDKGKQFLDDFETLSISSLKEKYMRTQTSLEAEETFIKFHKRFIEINEANVKRWKDKYNETNDAGPAYFAYIDAGESDKEFNEVFGQDSHGNTSDSSTHSDNHDSGSSCSSCSSCSSS